MGFVRTYEFFFSKHPDVSLHCAHCSSRRLLQNYHWTLVRNVRLYLYCRIWIVCKSHMPFCNNFILCIIWTPSLNYYFTESSTMRFLFKKKKGKKDFCEPRLQFSLCSIQRSSSIRSALSKLRRKKLKTCTVESKIWRSCFPETRAGAFFIKI